jgi:hypothetical protein
LKNFGIACLPAAFLNVSDLSIIIANTIIERQIKRDTNGPPTKVIPRRFPDFGTSLAASAKLAGLPRINSKIAIDTTMATKKRITTKADFFIL